MRKLKCLISTIAPNRKLRQQKRVNKFIKHFNNRDLMAKKRKVFMLMLQPFLLHTVQIVINTLLPSAVVEAEAEAAHKKESQTILKRQPAKMKMCSW